MPHRAAFTEQLGYRFRNPDLLDQALTHPSLSTSRSRKKSTPPPYERLEFLGDRVLGLVIAERLYELYPNSPEGDLAKRHAALVNRDALKAIALTIGLDKVLRLARGEEPSAARKNLTTLSDAMEAVIGALYLDGGLEIARGFIQRHWQKTIVVAQAPADPKTALQEWAQGQGLPLPKYRVVEHSGPAHAPKFRIEVTVSGHPPALAEGQSKREAEKAAAELFLKQLADIKDISHG
jgi:ribonuclease-3